MRSSPRVMAAGRFAVLAAFLGSGCGADPVAEAPRTPPAPADANGPASITMTGTRFDPGTLTIDLGASIVWTNDDPFPHTAAAEGTFASPVLSPGETWTFTPATKGDIEYVCTLHPTMRGRIHVR